MNIEEALQLLSKLEKLDLLDDILSRLDKVETVLRDRNDEAFLDDFIPLEKAIKLLGVSKRTFYTHRKNGKVSYRRVGKNIYLTKGDMQEFMNAHSIRAKNLHKYRDNLKNNQK
jgi:hypothetical protein